MYKRESVRRAIRQLSKLSRRLYRDNVASRIDFRDWLKDPDNKAFLEKSFGYHRMPKSAPPIESLISVNFHPDLPLMIWNYAHAAQGALYAFPRGWTYVLRICRGVVFDSGGNLCALPFPKFFNVDDEHPTLGGLTGRSFEATVKQDGHLAIIFRYRDRFVLTTRGSFTSRSARSGQERLDTTIAINRPTWESLIDGKTTILAEMINEDTRVVEDYGKTNEFRVIGFIDHDILIDHRYPRLHILANQLGIACTGLASFDVIEDVLTRVRQCYLGDIEGYVVRMDDGERIKFKTAGYLNDWFWYQKMGKNQERLLRYCLRLVMNGNFEAMLGLLVPERKARVNAEISRVITAIRKMDITLTPSGQLPLRVTKELYDLLPEGAKPPDKQVIRDFTKWSLERGHPEIILT